mgnify:CR=1 FL=1
MRKIIARAASLTACLWTAAAMAQADPVADFYKGRTVTVLVGVSVGGGGIVRLGHEIPQSF